MQSSLHIQVNFSTEINSKSNFLGNRIPKNVGGGLFYVGGLLQFKSLSKWWNFFI